MIAVSRNRTYSDERSIETAVAKTKSPTTIRGKRSQVHSGDTPKARTKIRTTTRFTPRLNRLVTTTDSGITRRGNCVFRTTLSWATTDITEVCVASEKKPNSTTFMSSSTG